MMKTKEVIQGRIDKLTYQSSLSFEDSRWFDTFEEYCKYKDLLLLEMETLKWVLNPQTYCVVVTCLPCSTPFPSKEAPHGCASCGMLDWLGAYNTEEECNTAYKAQYPTEFNNNGKHVEENQ